ncbi:hypothetical protein AGABI1DRAFT_115711 [Agaricus bisporus var. burnettii JB137-S8]|uniref:Uncharacterized protein n=2 Tax=Agaricus bisporus var. burnettii TaxID=192524 RepID=K5X169_AGABU|nr:uncharacterized protein AGABI1DRAFT_115711 [Agaricus bisporus var. burnettii JB137-S8]EKM76622.1 hypothetical protein AGABI1DRAFT_115711 [Agaricus bisporus var. burnettii JB137-S8]KAF7759647.1 hypothetical protein Agabi119p4_11342 [Agaricus bisporus var. burnettii]
MESLNLNTLATSLPTAQQKAEQELLNNFKAAALSITTLYRSSRQNAKRAHNAGYAAACQDLLTMIQQGVSVGGLGNPMPSSSSDADDGGMTIGRVMDWTEARLEAIRAQEEEEDEEEEREKEKERTRSTSCVPPSHNKPATSNSSPPPSLPTPSSPTVNSSNPPPEPITPSPALHPSNEHRPTQRSKPRAASKGDLLGSHPNIPTIPSTSVFNFMPEMVTPISPPITFPEMPSLPAVGTKRRHAMMMMLDAATPTTTGSNTTTQSPSMANSPASPASFSGPARRRTRSNRGHQQNQNINNMMQAPNESMDIEDDGRERKRVARR